MKKTLQEQYNLIKEGKGHKDMFVKEARQLFPNLLPNIVEFKGIVNELKKRNIINDSNSLKSNQNVDYFKIFKENMDVKANSTKPRNEIVDMETQGYDFKDKEHIENVFSNQFLVGFTAEMKDPKNKDKDVDEIKEIVRKNLTSDFNYYIKDGVFGVKGVGYETMPEPKEPKGPHKSSGYGSLNETKLSNIIKSVLKEDIDIDIEPTIDEYNEGFDAQIKGLGINKNPYPKGTQKYKKWHRGWAESKALTTLDMLDDEDELWESQLGDNETSGLVVFPDFELTDDEDSTIEQIKSWLADSDFYAEYDDDQKVFFFPETPDAFDELENILKDEFDALNIDVEFSYINNEDTIDDDSVMLNEEEEDEKYVQLSDEEVEEIYNYYPELSDPYFKDKKELPDFEIPYGFSNEAVAFEIQLEGESYLVVSDPKLGDFWFMMPDIDYEWEEVFDVLGNQVIKENFYGNKDITGKFEHLSDEEVLEWAEEDGLLDVVETDEYGNLINREEVLNAILGTETPNTDIEGDFIDQKGNKLDMLNEDHLDSDLPQPAMDIINHIMMKYGKGSEPYNKVESIIFNGWDGEKLSWDSFQKLFKYISDLYKKENEPIDDEILDALFDENGNVIYTEMI